MAHFPSQQLLIFHATFRNFNTDSSFLQGVDIFWKQQSNMMSGLLRRSASFAVRASFSLYTMQLSHVHHSRPLTRAFHFSNLLRAAEAPSNGSSNKISDPMAALVQQHVRTNSVFLYMKGTPKQPRCGFSQRVVQILNKCGVPYATYDITEDDFAICDAVEAFSKWPTYPQLFISGELVGGCDITTELYRSGELQDLLKDAKAVDPASTK
jgi:monothiol glutaredoxin